MSKQQKKKRKLAQRKKVQNRFKKRVSEGKSGLTGGKKGTGPAGKPGSTISIYRQSQKKQVQDAAKIRNAAFQAERDVKSGQVPGQGGAMSQAARDAAAKQLAAKRAEIAAAEKKEATRKNAFDPNRLSNTFTGNNNLGINTTAAFASPAVRNFAATSFDKASSWYNKGRLPNESKMSIRDLFRNDLKQQQQIGKFNPNRKLNFASYARGESNPFRGMPGYGTITGQGEIKGGFQTGPTPSVRQAIERPLKTAFSIGKFFVNPKAAILAAVSAPTPLADGTLEGKPTRFDTQAGGLNIGGGGVDSEEGSSTGRTVVTTDRDKNINYDIGGIAGEAAMRYNRLPASALDAITGNRFDFDNLGRPGDDKTIAQKVESLKKSPIKKAVLSAQTGVDANRIINEGGAAAENLMKNYVSQIDTSSAKGIRNPIARLFRDTSGKNQTDATAMAGRAMSAFSVDDPNFSNDPNKLTQMLKFAGVPQLSEENVQDIRHTMNTNVTEDTGIAGKGLTNIPYSQAFGLANRITSGKIKDGVEESMNQLGMNNVSSIDDAVALGAQYGTNMNTEGTVTAKRMGELNSLYQKYGPGGGQAPTLPSIIKGIGGAVGRRGGSGSPMQIQGGGGMTATLPTAPPAVQQEYPLPVIPQTGVANNNLQNIQQNAYNNQMSMYMQNPNYFAQFMPQQRFPRRGRFRSAFSRDYFN